MLKEYIHKETWSRRGKDFLIEVVRWETIPKEKWEEMRLRVGLDTGRFVWNVYCYIYPKHPLFSKFEKEDMFGCPIENFHCGCTFAKWYRDEKSEVTCKTYGCDYNHLHDERFTYIEKPEMAISVFCDAEALFKELEVEP